MPELKKAILDAGARENSDGTVDFHIRMEGLSEQMAEVARDAVKRMFASIVAMCERACVLQSEGEAGAEMAAAVASAVRQKTPDA